MVDKESPTLADDEASLRRYGDLLADAFERCAVDWLHRLVEDRSPGLVERSGTAVLLDEAALDTVAVLRSLLQTDIADQRTGPLDVVRRGILVPTRILAADGVPVAARDEFAVRMFPDDLYGLSPASFREVHPSLHEPGLTWGAAKAHVHMRRRREQS